METKTISSKYIIQRLLANHTFDDTNWKNDAIDWVGQAMRFIGKHAGFPVKMCCDAYVENHHVCYPAGFEGLIAVVYKGEALLKGSSPSGINYEVRNPAAVLEQGIADNDVLVELNGLIAQKNELIEQYAITPTDTIADEINRVAGRINVLEIYINVANQYQTGRKSSTGEFFYEKENMIQTSFATGYVDIIYASFALDEEGFPLLIDNEFYIQAIEWYIILMLIQKGYTHPIFTWETAYKMFWGDGTLQNLGWRAKAANNVRMPSIQDAERFTRMWEQSRTRRTLPLQLFNRTEQLYGLTF